MPTLALIPLPILAAALAWTSGAHPDLNHSPKSLLAPVLHSV